MREGIEDFKLLGESEKKNPDMAYNIAGKVVRLLTDYILGPANSRRQWWQMFQELAP